MTNAPAGDFSERRSVTPLGAFSERTVLLSARPAAYVPQQSIDYRLDFRVPCVSANRRIDLVGLGSAVRDRVDRISTSAPLHLLWNVQLAHTRAVGCSIAR